MKSIFYAGVGLLALALCSAASFAQCSPTWTTQDFHCDGPNNCHGDITVMYPSDPSQYGAGIAENSEECCGQLFSSFNPSGSCEPMTLRRRDVKERLAELSGTSEVIVADCKGRYGLYTPPTAKEKSGSWALLNDRMLR